MLKSKSCTFFVASLAAFALAGCDTGGSDTPQGGEEVSSETGDEQLAGTIDHTFAGSTLPEVTLTHPDGTSLDLATATGKPVLLNLWATWCAPCVVEMPLLDEIAGEMGEDLTVLTVSEDMRGAELVVPFFEEKGFTNLPQWMDPTNDLAFAFGGGAVLPLTVLYNAEGEEVWRVIGAYDWASEEARVAIEEGIAASAS